MSGYGAPSSAFSTAADLYWQQRESLGNGAYGAYQQNRYGSFSPAPRQINTNYNYGTLQRQGSGYSPYNSMPSSPYGNFPSSPYATMPSSPYGSHLETSRSNDTTFARYYAQEYGYGSTQGSTYGSPAYNASSRQGYSPYTPQNNAYLQSTYSPQANLLSQARQQHQQQQSAHARQLSLGPHAGYASNSRSPFPRSVTPHNANAPSMAPQQARGIPADNRAFRTSQPPKGYMQHKQHMANRTSIAQSIRGDAPSTGRRSLTDTDYATQAGSVVGQDDYGGYLRDRRQPSPTMQRKVVAQGRAMQAAPQVSTPSQMSPGLVYHQQGQDKYQGLVKKKQHVQQVQQQTSPPMPRIGGPPAAMAPPPSMHAGAETNAVIMNQMIRDPQRLQIHGALSDFGDCDRQSVVSLSSMKSFQTVQAGRQRKRFQPRANSGKLVAPPMPQQLHLQAPPTLPRTVGDSAGPSRDPSIPDSNSPLPSANQAVHGSPFTLNRPQLSANVQPPHAPQPYSGPLEPSMSGSEPAPRQQDDVLELYTLLRHVLFLVEQKDCETEIIEKQLSEALIEAKQGAMSTQPGCTGPIFASKRKHARVRELEVRLEEAEEEICMSKQRRQELSRKIAEILPMVQSYNLNNIITPTQSQTLPRPDLYREIAAVEDKMRMLNVKNLAASDQHLSGKIPSERIPVGITVNRSGAFSLPKTNANSGSDNSGENYDSCDDKTRENAETPEDQSPLSVGAGGNPPAQSPPRRAPPSTFEQAPAAPMFYSLHSSSSVPRAIDTTPHEELNSGDSYTAMASGESGLNAARTRSLSSLDGMLNSIAEVEGLERIVEEPNTPLTYASTAQGGSTQDGRDV